VREKGRGGLGVLTTGTKGRRGGGLGRAAVDQGGINLELWVRWFGAHRGGGGNTNLNHR
jgi:hypothetical protein